MIDHLLILCNVDPTSFLQGREGGKEGRKEGRKEERM